MITPTAWWNTTETSASLLKSVDDLGIKDNTIVIYSTTTWPNQFSWPDAATTPFRNEKNSNGEGAFRVPAMIRLQRRVCVELLPAVVRAGELFPEN